MTDVGERLDGLRELPKVVAAAVERGWVARVPPTMSVAAQRLFESLGVPVLFDSKAAEPDLDKVVRGTRKRRKRRRASSTRPRGQNRELLLRLMEDGSAHSVAELREQGVPSATVYLGFMIQEGIVERVSKGVYRRIVIE